MKKEWLCIVCVLFLSIFLITSTVSTSCAPSVKTGEPYKIGVTAARTGPAAISYVPSSEGFRIYMEKLNDEGGINGHPVELIIEDNASQGGKAGSDVRKFAEMGAHLVMVASTSATFGPSIAEAKKANIPILFGAGSVSPAEALPPNPEPLVFATSDKGLSADPYRAVQTVSLLATPPVTFGMITADIPVAVAQAEKATELGKAKGWTVIEDRFPMGTVDLTPVAAEWIRKGVNWALEFGPVGARLMYPALMKQGWKGNFILMYEAFNYLTEHKADNLHAICSVAPLETMSLPDHKEITEAAEKYKASTLLTENLWGWDTAKVVEEILKKAGYPPTTEKLLKVMSDFEFDDRPLARVHKWTPTDHLGTLVWRAYKWDKGKGAIVPVTDWWRASAAGEVEKIGPKL